jgi:hypothetical protein
LHVTTEAEWDDLMDCAGTSHKSGDNPAKLKQKGKGHWKASNTGTTYEIFFIVLPALEGSYFSKDAETGTKINW